VRFSSYADIAAWALSVSETPAPGHVLLIPRQALVESGRTPAESDEGLCFGTLLLVRRQGGPARRNLIGCAP